MTCCLLRSRKSAAAGHSSCESPGREQAQDFVRSSPARQTNRLTRLKEEDVSDNIPADTEPQLLHRVAQFRGPGRPRGFPVHQRLLRLSQAAGSSAVHTTSSSEVAMEKDDEAYHNNNDNDEAGKVDTEHHQSSANELNPQNITIDSHDYYQTLTQPFAPTTERWAPNGMVFNRPKHLDLVNHTISKSDSVSVASDWDRAGFGSSSSVLNGANVSCASDDRLSGVETDHAYAKRAPTPPPEKLLPSRQCEVDSGDVLARLTILNAGSSRVTRPPPRDCYAAPMTLQKCTVTLNKLSDSIFEPQSKLRLQLRNLEPRMSKEQHSTVERNGVRGTVDYGTLSVDGCLPSVCDGQPVVNARETTDGSRCNFVEPTGLTFGGGERSGGWDTMRSHDNGLELLASVSSLTADRLQQTVPPEPPSCNDDIPCWTRSETGHCQPPEFTLPPSGRRSVKVFCVRKSRVPPVDFVSEETRLDLLGVVRDFIAKGGSGPECGTVPSRSPGREVRPRGRPRGRGRVTCSRRSEEIACNSLLFMHSSCSPLQNGVTEHA